MATFYKYVASARISTWLTSDGREEQRVERRMEVSAVEMEHGIRNEQQQHRPRVQARPEPSRKKTFLDGCCTNSLFHPFIDTDDTFTHGLWAVLTLPAICCISGIYCIVKAVKETIF
ncbi:uncharacterized protein LOC128229880 isoform X2 [Mya arenaria]|uniref:uncharacterized protein LOC128229880 isoform X2 n=1 Tax=Mya arenaria TaxID=6604 RepID=UPI0022E80149|nr:uncharacterized protein LOC128229880 isoform X2 [Mya arenaria]